MSKLKTIAISCTIALIAVLGFAYSGSYDVSAGSSHSSIVTWLLSTTAHASIERRAKEIEVPDLSDEALARAGVNDFNGMCAGCHGAPGRDPEAMGQGLNPLPPNLAESAAEMSPAELFWVTKNGIKMTGMPAWGVTHALCRAAADFCGCRSVSECRVRRDHSTHGRWQHRRCLAERASHPK